MTAPRVLHLFANYKWTGPADPAIRTAARLRQQGLDVAFAQAGFVHAGGEHRIAEELWRWRLPVTVGLQLRKHFHVPSLLADVRTLRQLLRRDRIDVVHCHLPADHLLAAVAVRKLTAPPLLVRTLYDPQPPPRGWRERYAFSRTGGVLAPTAAVAAAMQSQFGFAKERVLLQEPVIEPRARRGPDLREAWGAAATDRLVGITARIQPHRRFELLWETAARVVRARPDTRFVLLGRGNDADTDTLVREPIRRLGLGEHVLLPGYLREPQYSAALRSLDVFLFLVPGSDGTCRAVREAMAFGLPVVATRRGILPELLAPSGGDAAAGVCCDETSGELARELLVLLDDQPRRERAGAAALQRTRRDMDPTTAAARLCGFYAELLAAHRDGPRR